LLNYFSKYAFSDQKLLHTAAYSHLSYIRWQGGSLQYIGADSLIGGGQVDISSYAGWGKGVWYQGSDHGTNLLYRHQSKMSSSKNIDM
jgi:hypothetical protein